MTAERLSLARLAAMDRAAFVAALGDVFEHAAWVAEGAWPQHPFASEAALHAAMMAVVHAAPVAQQTAFLRGHPELAGKEAQAGTMTGHSTFEQSGAGLNALSRAELDELQRLNAAYAERHGFPFIINVLGHTKAQIFDALRARVANDTANERHEALRQIAAITQRRLAKLLAAE
ncbi:MAG: 2-oxo-4-hydroxy-4-carboxy-5-ureidoimidazoline decarboxylase [Burkholderiales bacterium]